MRSELMAYTSPHSSQCSVSSSGSIAQNLQHREGTRAFTSLVLAANLCDTGEQLRDVLLFLAQGLGFLAQFEHVVIGISRHHPLPMRSYFITRYWTLSR